MNKCIYGEKHKSKPLYRTKPELQQTIYRKNPKYNELYTEKKTKHQQTKHYEHATMNKLQNSLSNSLPHPTKSIFNFHVQIFSN